MAFSFKLDSSTYLNRDDKSDHIGIIYLIQIYCNYNNYWYNKFFNVGSLCVGWRKVVYKAIWNHG